jgi:Ca-activated chloride channel family protein
MGKVRCTLIAACGAVSLWCLTAARSDAAGLLIADGGFGGQLEIKEHDVKVTINNGVAVTEINQVFQNTENRVVEALYTFPVPKGASVANFSMWIGGKEMIGEVVEKKRARQIYESYKTTRRDPGLLEQVDYKRFEMRIFPIAAGAEQRVKVTYYQELDFDHDQATYVYPLATATRSDAKQATTGKFALSLEAKSEVPIVEMKSPSHEGDFVIVSHTPNYYQASLEARGGDLSRDLVLHYRHERPKTGFDIVTSKQAGEDGYYLLTLVAGKELAELNRGMDYVFILDVSGSMAHDGKLAVSRQSLGAFIDGLDQQDRFEVISFNVSANTLFNKLSAVNDEAKKQAGEFLSSQRARGGTLLRPALTAAYRYRDADRTLNVVVLSDGMTEQREQQELLQLIGQRPAGSRVFCIGVGNEVNRPLLQQLAEDAGGLAAFLSQGDDFQRQSEAFRRKLLRPAATGLTVGFDGGSVYDVEPEKLPNLYHGAPLRMYGRYRKAGPVKVTIAGEVLGSPFQQTVEVTLPETDDKNPEIERMWAWHRMERLLNEARRNGSTKSVEDEIVRLCEGYSIVSEYASFIVLENDAEYQRWKIDRRNATRVERDRAAQAALRQTLDELRQESMAKLGPAKNGDAEKGLAATERDPAGPPQNAPGAAPTATTPPDDPAARSRDLDFGVNPGDGSRGGAAGGAIDPVTGSLAAALALAALAGARKRRRGSGAVTGNHQEE